MISLTAEEFENHTFSCKDGSIIFQDKSFVEGPTFSQSHYAKAVDYCKQYAKSGIFCLLQEGAFYFTVWLQKLELEEPSSSNSNSTNNSSKSRWFKASSSSLKNPLPQTSNEQVNREEKTPTSELKSPESESPESEVKDLEFGNTLNSLIEHHFGEQQSSDTLELKSSESEVKDLEFGNTLNSLIENHFGEQQSSETLDLKSSESESPESEVKDLEFDNTLNSLIEHHFGEQQSSDTLTTDDDSAITDQVKKK